MQITASQNLGGAAQIAISAATQPKNEHAIAPSPSLPEAALLGKASAVAKEPVERSTDVSLRRDSNGRVYYVVSDATSGQEILEVPPKALRDVSQGIEDYLKEAQSKANSRVEVKA
jgi:hypothetical protein